jgi:hypothetical protein
MASLRAFPSSKPKAIHCRRDHEKWPACQDGKTPENASKDGKIHIEGAR